MIAKLNKRNTFVVSNPARNVSPAPRRPRGGRGAPSPAGPGFENSPRRSPDLGTEPCEEVFWRANAAHIRK
jgi:hypothetical protein